MIKRALQIKEHYIRQVWPRLSANLWDTHHLLLQSVLLLKCVQDDTRSFLIDNKSDGQQTLNQRCVIVLDCMSLCKAGHPTLMPQRQERWPIRDSLFNTHFKSNIVRIKVSICLLHECVDLHIFYMLHEAVSRIVYDHQNNNIVLIRCFYEDKWLVKRTGRQKTDRNTDEFPLHILPSEVILIRGHLRNILSASLLRWL